MEQVDRFVIADDDPWYVTRTRVDNQKMYVCMNLDYGSYKILRLEITNGRLYCTGMVSEPGHCQDIIVDSDRVWCNIQDGLVLWDMNSEKLIAKQEPPVQDPFRHLICYWDNRLWLIIDHGLWAWQQSQFTLVTKSGWGGHTKDSRHPIHVMWNKDLWIALDDLLLYIPPHPSDMNYSCLIPVLKNGWQIKQLFVWRNKLWLRDNDNCLWKLSAPNKHFKLWKALSVGSDDIVRPWDDLLFTWTFETNHQVQMKVYTATGNCIFTWADLHISRSWEVLGWPEAIQIHGDWLWCSSGEHVCFSKYKNHVTCMAYDAPTRRNLFSMTHIVKRDNSIYALSDCHDYNFQQTSIVLQRMIPWIPSNYYRLPLLVQARMRLFAWLNKQMWGDAGVLLPHDILYTLLWWYI